MDFYVLVFINGMGNTHKGKLKRIIKPTQAKHIYTIYLNITYETSVIKIPKVAPIAVCCFV